MTEFVNQMFSLHPIVFISIVLLITIVVLTGLIVGCCYAIYKLGLEFFDDDYFGDDDGSADD